MLNIEYNNLDEVLATFATIAKACEKEKTYALAENVCIVSRETWSLYLHDWIKNGHYLPEKSYESLLDSLTRGSKVLEEMAKDCLEYDKKDGPSVCLMHDNIAFRLKLLEAMREGGTESLRNEFENREPLVA